jgi:hypothetical protein
MGHLCITGKFHWLLLSIRQDVNSANANAFRSEGEAHRGKFLNWSTVQYHRWHDVQVDFVSGVSISTEAV